MIPLFRDDAFRFRFADDRVIPKFHLEGLPVGTEVVIHRLRPEDDSAGAFIRYGVVGVGGWVEMTPPLRVAAGEGFIVTIRGSDGSGG